ncbi:hypothetical protein ABZT06_24385 [Streptomyces sp. NPDC005483]
MTAATVAGRGLLSAPAGQGVVAVVAVGLLFLLRDRFDSFNGSAE